ncbi:MAG: BatD family protein [Candidatus Cloacimonetes bacterium]|nr:BatD family protein [Candidatus Cloacimonadota bacterium]
MKKIIFLAIFILLAVFAMADDLQVTAYVNRTTIGINDILQYTIEISGSDADKIGTPNLPQLDGFKNQGVSTSSSSSYTMTNGSFQSSVTKKYQYSLSPTRTGSISIPSITIKYKKKSYKTGNIKLNVVPGSNEPAPARASTRNNNSPAENSGKLSDNIFIEIQVSNLNPYQNESVEVTYNLFSKYDVTSLSFKEEPSFIGFWKEDVFTPNRMNLQRTNRNGELYNTMKLKTYAIFPSQTGEIKVDPLKMDVDIRTESRNIWSFGSTKTYTIASKPLSFKVKELPPGAPADFSGAVGNFQLNSSVSETQLKVGDSFTYTLEISGRGNFSNLNIATLPEINHLRFLDPETSSDITASKVNGKKTIRYLVVAQEPGNFSIPSLPFSYFDPGRNKYVTLRSDKYALDVKEGDNIYIPGTTSQASIHLEGSDIGFIIENRVMSSFKPWFDSILYWLLLFVIFLSLPITTLLMKRHTQIAGDMDYQRQKRANRVLKKYLKLATEYYKSANPDFYYAAQSGLENYLTDKLKIARGSRKDQIISQATHLGYSKELVEKINLMFNKCNEARFMPGGFLKENIQTDYASLRDIVAEIAKSRIKGK